MFKIVSLVVRLIAFSKTIRIGSISQDHLINTVAATLIIENLDIYLNMFYQECLHLNSNSNFRVNQTKYVEMKKFQARLTP